MLFFLTLKTKGNTGNLKRRKYVYIYLYLYMFARLKVFAKIITRNITNSENVNARNEKEGKVSQKKAKKNGVLISIRKKK